MRNSSSDRRPPTTDGSPTAAGFKTFLLAALVATLISGCGQPEDAVSESATNASDSSAASAESAPAQQTSAVLHAEVTQQINTFCGDCHATPLPASFPKDAWFSEVKRGFNFYTESGRTDLQIPRMDSIVAWFRQEAPDKLTVPPLLQNDPSPVPFEKAKIPAPPSVGDPMVASVLWTDTEGSPWSPGIRICDMRSGTTALLPGSSIQELRELQTASHPARSLLADLDGDGIQDLVIAELGSQLPADHQLGRISVRLGADPAAAPLTILSGTGRIADVRAADFDQDGDMDLIAAEFGWMKTGSILLLERTDDQAPLSEQSYQRHTIDRRHGTIHVPVVDLNGDGNMDFVALVSQEYESIDVFYGNGDLTFRRVVLHAANDPSFGSSGIELTDIEGDGDIDIVYSNGDTLDSYLVKPYHGVHLLINEGSEPFRAVKLVGLPGASAVATGDFDGDGDMDIAVACFLPLQLLDQLPTGTYDTLVWLEQTGVEEFRPHVIETSSSGHLAVTAGDFDQDGRTDICVGNYLGEEWGAIWWNRRMTGP